jgi:hypothetical protein
VKETYLRGKKDLPLGFTVSIRSRSSGKNRQTKKKVSKIRAPYQGYWIVTVEKLYAMQKRPN